MNKKGFTNRILAGVLAFLMVLTSLPETALIASAEAPATAHKISFIFNMVDTSDDALVSEEDITVPSLDAIDIAAGNNTPADGFHYTADATVSSENFASIKGTLFTESEGKFTSLAAEATFDATATYYTRDAADTPADNIALPAIPTVENYTAPTAWTISPAGAVTVDNGKLSIADSTLAGYYNDGINITLTATYTGDTNTVAFDSNGGSEVSSASVTYPAKVTKPSNPTWAHHTLTGWYYDTDKDADFEGEFDFTNTIIEKDTYLYAAWKADDYELTLDAQSGTVSPAKKTVYYGDTYGTLPTPTRAGYTFVGWNTKSDGLGTAITKDSEVEDIASEIDFAASPTLYAIWEANEITVTYDANGGNVSPTSKTVTVGSTYGDLATPQRAGYTFAGWYTDPKDGTEVKNSTSVTATSNHTIYAHWKGAVCGISYEFPTGASGKREEYVTYKEADSSAGTPAEYDKFDAYSESDIIVEPAAATVTGKSFKGWYLDSAMTSKPLTQKADGKYLLSVKTVGSGVTLYAKYEADVYDVTYDNSVASDSKYKTVTYTTKPLTATNGEDLVISIPTRENYKFKAFEIKVNGGSDIYSTTMLDNADLTKATKVTVPKASITNDISVKVVWELKKYDIKYNLDGGVDTNTNVTTYEIADSSTLGKITLAPATKTDYEFDGWFSASSKAAASALTLNESTGNYEYQIKDSDTSGLTFYAKFKNQTGTYYNITYTLNGGTQNPQNPTKLLANNEVSAEGVETKKDVVFYVPERTGYDFAGWYKDADLSQALTAGIDGNGDGIADDWTWTGISNEEIKGQKVKVYAKWTLKTFTITFNYGDGATTIKNATGIEYGTEFGDIAEFEARGLSKTGYTLTGYYYEDADNDNAKVNITATDKVTKAVTLIGVWTGADQAVTFHSAYPTAGATESTTVITAKAGTTIKLPDNSFTVPAGYKFLGWNTDKDDALAGTVGANMTAGKDYSVSVNASADEAKNNVVDFYAVWKVSTYSVIFDIGEGLVASDINSSAFTAIENISKTYEGKTYSGLGHIAEMKAGDELILTGKEFVRNGYTLENWTSSKGGTVSNGTVQSLSSNDGDVVKLSANWTIDNYAIKLVTNGGTFTDEQAVNVKAVSSYNVNTLPGQVALPEPAKKGYIFTGWFTDPELYAETEIPEAKYNVGAAAQMYSATLYAGYAPVTYNIAFVDDDGTAIKTEYGLEPGDSVKVADIVKNYPNAFKKTKTGYKLNGFTTTLPGQTKETTYKTNATLKDLVTSQESDGVTVTLTADYEANSYKISYALGGGSQKQAKTTYKSGTGVELAIPTRTGYEFAGWKSSVDTVKIDGNSITADSYGAVKLTALWTGVDINIILTDAETEYTSTITTTYGSTVNLGEAAAALQSTVGKDTAVKQFYQLVGKKKVKYNLNKFYSTTKFGKDALDDNSVTLYAVWTKSGTFNISYAMDETDDSEQGLATTDRQTYPRTYTVKKVAKFPTPKKTGYVFKGWTTNFDASTETTPITTSKALIKAIKAQKTEAADVLLTPNFEKVEYTVNILPNASGVTSAGEKVTNKTPYTVEEIKYADGTNVTFAALDWSRKGYNFKGFATDKKGKKMLTAAEDGSYDISKLATKNGKKVSVYAIWNNANKWYVTSNLGVLLTENNQDVIIGDGAGETTDPSYVELFDKAWNDSSAWNGRTKEGVFGKAVTLKKPAIAGYRFVGWVVDDNTDTTNNSFKIDKNGYITGIAKDNVANVTLRAVYEPNSYTVKFDYNGGYYYDSTTKTKSSTAFDFKDARDNKVGFDCNLVQELKADYSDLTALNEVAKAQKDGYVLAGFAYDAAGKQNINSYRFTPKANSVVTIYPIWVVPKVTAFDATGGSKSVTATFDGNIDESYEVQCSETIGFRADETITTTKTVSKGTVTFSGLKASTTYYVRVRPVVINPDKEKAYGEWTTIKQVVTH